MAQKTLVVLLGPTGVGKTRMSIELARNLGTPIVSCDSRQIYKEMSIGTAAPTKEQLAAVAHFFVRTVSVRESYSCWLYERQALEVIGELFRERDVVLMAGGSMLYIDAVCCGMDDVPDVDPDVREEVKRVWADRGIEYLRSWLKMLDPVQYGRVDLRNGKRVAHALEVCLSSGKPYSSFLTGRAKERDFRMIKVGLRRDRGELYGRIDRRVDEMLENGLEEEARMLYPLRGLNALDTVGYKEWFSCFDGAVSKKEAVRLIKMNTRHYAKKQMSWFRRDGGIRWFDADDATGVWEFVACETGAL